MKTKIRSMAIAAAALTLATSAIVASPAQADNTWISGPSLTHVSILATGAVASGNGVTLSTQTTTFTLAYRSSAADSGKFAQVNFFDLTSGLSLAMTSANPASSTGCDQQVLGGNSHSCMFKLDGAGSANVTGVLSGVTASASLKYLLLSGPNIAQTNPANIAFALPRNTVKALAATSKVMAPGAAVLRFRFYDGAAAAASIRATVALTGIGDHISATSVISDSNGYVWVYVANLKKKYGNSTVTLTVDGTANKAVTSIRWVAGTLAK
jgi:hypothetical protein